jgi:hypothetical protein
MAVRVGEHAERARANVPAVREDVPKWYARTNRMEGIRRVRKQAAAGALATAFAGAILLLAGESTSAPPSLVPADVSVEAARETAPTARASGCLVEVNGAVKGRGPCTIEYFTEPPSDGGFAVERTTVRIVGRAPALLVDLSFFNEPRVGPQADARDGGWGRMFYGSARIERDGQKWEARSHVESDFRVTVSSVKSTCNDGGLKCWEIHGRVQANVPSALLSPFASPLELSVIF